MPPWLAILGGLIVVVGFLAGAAGYIGHATDKATINSLKESNDAFWLEIDKVLRPEVAKLTRSVEFLKRENDQLRQGQATDVLLEMKSLLETHTEILRLHDINTRPLLAALSKQLKLGELVDDSETGT